jgi:hypothetical protein
MRDAAQRANDIRGMQAWAGQSAALARAEPAAAVVRRLWTEALSYLGYASCLRRKNLGGDMAQHLHQLGDFAPLVFGIARDDRMLDAMLDMVA